MNDLQAERDSLAQALSSVSTRRQRWDDAYEAEVIDLSTYSQRLQGLEEQQAGLQYRLSTIEKQLARSRTLKHRRTAIQQAIEAGPPPLEDRTTLKVYLRKIIERIEVKDGQIQRIVMRA